MKEHRRNFMIKLGTSLGLSKVIKAKDHIVPASKKKYKVTFECRVNHDADFRNERKKWEDPQRVIEISKQYSEAGKLLSHNYKKEGDLRIWEYIFVDRVTYEEWSRELFFTDSFKYDHVDARFSYTVKGEYIG